MAGEQTQSSDPRPSTVVVTSENLAEFQAKKLGIEAPPKPGESKTEAPKGEPEKDDQANEAEAVLEEERKAEKDPKKQRLNMRFSELTDKRKQAETERDAAKAEAQRERDARLALEAKLNQDPAKGDKAKGSPPADAKPDRAKFKAGTEGDAEYEEAVLDYKLDQREAKRQQEAEQKRAQEADAAVKRTWAQNQQAIRAVIPDYDTKIAAAKVELSQPVTDAIVTMEGEAGPRCLYYFAEFGQEAERLKSLPIIAQLRELGKIEAKVMSGKQVPKKEEDVDVSKAPKPAVPLKTTSAPEALTDEAGNLRPDMTFKEYKEARKAGKIK